MKARKEYILLVFVIVALSFYLIFRNTNKTHYQLPKIPQIDKKEITKIEISKEETSILLNKKDNNWYISPWEYRADTDKVKGMLDVLGEFMLTDLVSEAKNYHLFDLTGDKKITVKAWASDSMKLGFELGRAAPSWNHTFVKLPDDIRVYYAKGNFKDKFDLTLEKLRDKTVLSFDSSEIREIQIIKGKQSIVLAKKEAPIEPVDKADEKDKDAPTPSKTETTWEDSEGKPADGSALNSLLSSLSNLSCDKYIDGKEKDDYTDAICTIVLKGTKEYTLSIFEKTDKDERYYPAISTENGYPFLLSEVLADRIMKNPDEMLQGPDKEHKE